MVVIDRFHFRDGSRSEKRSTERDVRRDLLNLTLLRYRYFHVEIRLFVCAANSSNGSFYTDFIDDKRFIAVSINLFSLFTNPLDAC